MAEKLLSDIISGQIHLDCFQEWLNGKNSEVISGSLSRTDFTLSLLKYIQEETNKFLPAASPPPATQLNTRNTQSSQENLLIDQINEKKANVQHDELKNQRTPFQVINMVTSTSTITSTQQLTRRINNGPELKRDAQLGSPGTDNRSILTSTPIHPRRNNSRNNHTPTSPPNSFHSDQSSLSHTPRSSKSSRYNLSPISPQTPPFSPSSPQYSESFPDLGAKSHSKRAPQSPCLGDFITTKAASQKSRKRIKPTQLTTPEKDPPVDCKRGSQISFGAVSRPFVPLSSQTEVKEQSNFDEERNLLKLKRTQTLKSSLDNTSTGLPPSTTNIDYIVSAQEQDSPKQSYICLNISVEKTVNNLASSPQNIKYILLDPDPNLVTSVEKIIRLSSVYSACLDANLVPNVTLEMYNIFTLLTAAYKSKVSASANSSKESVISDNTKESSSSSGYCNNLLEKLTLTEKLQHEESATSSCEGMQLQEQDETKSVFCSAHDCVMFSVCVLEKQIHTIQCLDKGTIRLLSDNPRISLFLPQMIPRLIQAAEVKEAKEASYVQSSMSFPIGNGPVLYQSETDNKDNFSSVENFNCFKKQRDGFYEILHEWKTKNSDNVWVSKRFPQRVNTLLSLSSDPVNMMHLARLFCAQMTSTKFEPNEELELAGVSKDKLSRLQARFSKPTEGGGSPRPPPAFPAEQQFYQHFLQLAVGSTFLHHVTDCLVYRLRLLDLTNFFVDGLSLEESKSQILACVSSSCLIAKFLGLIVFLPYKSNTPLAPDTLQAQILVRGLMAPSVHPLPDLRRALSTNRLVVTVPWLVAFLGMMDPVAPHLPSYQSLLQLLVSIYKALPLPHLSDLSNLLLRCSLGWLFDVSFFPQNVFSSLLSNCNPLEVRSAEAPDVDVMDVVDQTLLLEVCPYLVHLRQLLALSAGSRQAAARHITPVPVQLTPTTQTTVVQTMELQLEECFLSGQSVSFRSTVEVIVDRICSCCIKHICSNIISPAKERATEEIKLRKEVLSNTNKQETQVWIGEHCQRTESEVEATIVEHCGSKIEMALCLLLGPDLTDPTVRRVTQAICARRCRERIVNWLNSHIKLSDLFSKLVPGPESKPADTVKPSKDRQSVDHKDSAMAPADMIIELQDKLCECIESRSSVMSEEQVIQLINKAIETVKHRSDLIAIAEQTIFTLSVDLCIVLLAHGPATVTPAVVARLCALWGLYGGGSQLERVMSARNTLLLCQGGVGRARESWQQLSFVLVALLTHSPPLLTPLQLEAQCVALFRLDWPPMVLSLMGACLSSMLEKIKQDPISKQKPKFVLMLEWVNEMTEDLSRDDCLED